MNFNKCLHILRKKTSKGRGASKSHNCFKFLKQRILKFLDRFLRVTFSLLSTLVRSPHWRDCRPGGQEGRAGGTERQTVPAAPWRRGWPGTAPPILWVKHKSNNIKKSNWWNRKNHKICTAADPVDTTDVAHATSRLKKLSKFLEKYAAKYKTIEGKT